MQLLKFKSIRGRILVLLLPMILLALAMLTGISYNTAKQVILEEIGFKMNYQLDYTLAEINGSLMKHSDTIVSLAKAAEVMKSINGREEYQSLVEKYAALSDDTLGVGVWFELYKYKPDLKYFGPYGLKQDGAIVYTEEWCTEEYDYVNQGWYKSAKESGDPIVWSDPFFDEITQVTMVTTTVPFYIEGAFTGVATGDIDISSLQGLIQKIKVGKTGKAFLLGSQGMYLAHSDESKIMKMNITQESNSSLASLGERMLSEQRDMGTYKDSQGVYRVYYTHIPETQWVLALYIPETELFAPLQELLTRTVMIILIAAVLVLVLILMFSNYITAHTKRVKGFVQTVSGGDLTQTVQTKEEDELGQMVYHLSEMSLNLRQMIQKISTSLGKTLQMAKELGESSEQTQSAAEQIAESVVAISVGTEKQADLYQNALSVVSETNQGMKEIARSVETVVDSVGGALQRTEVGNEQIEVVVRQMSVINDKVTKSAAVVNHLGEQSNQIGKIISIITSIAQQTNLLALNAAIEAARAGEMGLGFAVVADEVRSLAEQSVEATGQIAGIIQQIQTDIQETIRVMSESTTAVTHGITLVDEAGGSFAEIRKSVTEVSNQTHEISSIVQQIYAGMENMSEAVENISAITHDTSENAENVAAAAEEQTALMREVADAIQLLTEMIRDLEKEVQFFRV